MEEITELHPVQNVPELSTSTQTPIRCISSVARRHSLDIDGSLISSCVSEARTPRPNINEEDPLEHVQERGWACLFSLIPRQFPTSYPIFFRQLETHLAQHFYDIFSVIFVYTALFVNKHKTRV